jgi:ATP-dependent 26S proteasome regulatory subunit
MNEQGSMTWHEANQVYLMAAVDEVRAALQTRAGIESTPVRNREEADEAFSRMSLAPALEQLCNAFGLSRFEREILLLCAGVDLDSSFALLIAAAQGDARLSYPTFGLALAALAEPHWSAIAPSGPLRHWRLLDVMNNETLTTSRLRIDERVLHQLAGVSHPDERLAGLVDSVSLPPELLPSQQRQAEQIAHRWTGAHSGTLPVIELCGDDALSKRSIAAAAAAHVSLQLYLIRQENLPHQPAELDALVRLWEREAVLSGNALLIESVDNDNHDHARETALSYCLENMRGALMVGSRARRRMLQRPMIAFEIVKPTGAEQRALWKSHLGDLGARLNGEIDLLGSHFDLTAGAIRAASAEALQKECAEADFSKTLRDICRSQARPRLDGLAQRLTPMARWSDLVLPESQKQILRDVAVHVRRRTQVYESWGFADKGTRGLGISALFAGPSGTGKTMAGEVLANELDLDLYHIDLSQVVNKYIGETEKNLRKVFDAAEDGGAILLFDEADALFGKRSEIKDSHDRFANIEISYLLQRMEAYRGLAILTTNMKSALDQAFLRRIRFVVQFPFPDAAQRVEIWRRVFPEQTPIDSLDWNQLARLQVAGGNIRNMAMNAAFLAADAGEPVCMTHLLRAAKSEYVKLERPLTESEIGGWR